MLLLLGRWHVVSRGSTAHISRVGVGLRGCRSPTLTTTAVEGLTGTVIVRGPTMVLLVTSVVVAVVVLVARLMLMLVMVLVLGTVVAAVVWGDLHVLVSVVVVLMLRVVLVVVASSSATSVVVIAGLLVVGLLLMMIDITTTATRGVIHPGEGTGVDLLVHKESDCHSAA